MLPVPPVPEFVSGPGLGGVVCPSGFGSALGLFGSDAELSPAVPCAGAVPGAVPAGACVFAPEPPVPGCCWGVAAGACCVAAGACCVAAGACCVAGRELAGAVLSSDAASSLMPPD
ncbi:hypothetical protein [Corallococcus sp. AB045]|uniref:hypothetical protein n=1 Tax=Corallococcus sp. AB045 TaxID=2316719 RepID=UPI0011C3A97A|nr:hypothetical protein [Corallococcus sp. AB045]